MEVRGQARGRRWISGRRGLLIALFTFFMVARGVPAAAQEIENQKCKVVDTGAMWCDSHPSKSNPDLLGTPGGEPQALDSFSVEADDPAGTLTMRDILPPAGKPNSVAERIERGEHVDPKLDVTKIGDRHIGDGVNLYSLEREQALGRELAFEVEHSAAVITDPIVSEYVNRLGQNLVRNSDARFPFTIKVLDDDEINAFALPGGFFYVNSGLILAADNEAELAGVMAHEIAHVAARHVTKNYTRAQIFNMASIPLIFMGGPFGYAAREIAGLAVPMGFLKFSRDAEREADLLGLQYQYRAGYDPQAFVEFFEKLKTTEKKKHSGLAKAFTTHPMTEDRIKAAQEEIEQDLPPRPEYIVTTSEFDEVKMRLMQLEDEHRVDAGHGAKPTLRKRTGGGVSHEDGPVLRKRDGAEEEK